ncbi:MAG: hypothetical protein M1823_002191 [Watsoniomyces obsoletus]|nr:MAG: hypothetical protein M1823_002191 [Watsoniomyces obsoletus]
MYTPVAVLPTTRRKFSSAPYHREQQQQQHYRNQDPFWTRLRRALRDTKVEWRPIPVGLGIAFLGALHFYRVRRRERQKEEDELLRLAAENGDAGDGGSGKRKRKRRIRPSGPWQVQAMYILPLKAISRVWGRFNELEIPVFLRVPGFKLYAWIFGVNLSEVAEPDLRSYPNLAMFFYRTLKPGCRPLDPNPNALLSPADGRVLAFGSIERGEVEQVKGMTYSLDALLGSVDVGTTSNPQAPSNIFKSRESKSEPKTSSVLEGDEDKIGSEEEFARVNGISYTLPDLFSGASHHTPQDAPTDASTTPAPSSEAEVSADLARGNTTLPWYARMTSENKTALYYVVVYLAPGDYHRFHSPTSWVVEKRRHFAGELYSVSPYLQRILPGLFTLNERVVLLGRWRWGFFSFTPVGATNVGSIKINFDRELRTNSLLTDTAADRAAEVAARRGETYSGYVEATYKHASRVLGGHALKRGEEMGGFQLGSSIVMVFEAPASKDEDEDGSDEKQRQKSGGGGWRWSIQQGQHVKVGQALGWVEVA